MVTLNDDSEKDQWQKNIHYKVILLKIITSYDRVAIWLNPKLLIQ